MKKTPALIDELELATSAATALIDMVCQLHAKQCELPPRFDALGTLVANTLEAATNSVKPSLLARFQQSTDVVTSN